MKKEKILIVDDDMDIINVLQTILKHENYDVYFANSKEEALKIATEQNPDLAILDVMMNTHYEGFELAEALRRDEQLSNIPILMQTSIEVLTTTKQSVRDMARHFRNDPKYKELQVILLKDIVTGNSGIDYRNENGRSVWLNIDGFLKKPVDSKVLLPEIKKQLNKTTELQLN